MQIQKPENTMRLIILPLPLLSGREESSIIAAIAKQDTVSPYRIRDVRRTIKRLDLVKTKTPPRGRGFVADYRLPMALVIVGTDP